MKKYLKIGFTLAIVLMLSAMLSCASATHHHKHKQLKPGKPIPCPHKDC